MSMLPLVVSRCALASDPFVLLDVGCALGIDARWRAFGDDLVAWGFDPQVDEVERLNAAEQHPGVRYRAAMIGLPDDHPWHAQAREERAAHAYASPLARSSCWAIEEERRALAPPVDYASAVASTDAWTEQRLVTEKTPLSDLVAGLDLSAIDLIKTDTDGSDFEVVVSSEGLIRSHGVLGYHVEVDLQTPPGETWNSLANVDRWMRDRGFALYDLTTNRYTRSALPGRFFYRAPYQTDTGQPMWADALYLRDAAGPSCEALSATKLLKLACLYELFGLPDCAAELVLTHGDRLERVIYTAPLLDALTPELDGRRVSHAEYLATFRRDPSRWYPD